MGYGACVFKTERKVIYFGRLDQIFPRDSMCRFFILVKKIARLVARRAFIGLGRDYLRRVICVGPCDRQYHLQLHDGISHPER